MKSWDLAKVFTYAIYWGIAFMILQVLVANLTVVFLSWMIEKTANLGLVPVTGIMCAVGVMMFLLPPVPGVPVYLTLGIVLSAQGHAILGKWAGVEVSPWFIQIMISMPSHRNTLHYYRLDWIYFLRYSSGRCIEALFKRFTTEGYWGKPLTLCQSETIRWYQQ